MADPIRIGNIAGLFGDRPAAAREMLDGPFDVITGDWLAELTMLILARTRSRRPDGGYGRTFVAQMEDVMADCLDRGIRVVVNAGGLDPTGCATAVSEAAARQGLEPAVAAITGDDLAPRLPDLIASGIPFDHFDTGEPLGGRAERILTANAYLGAWGIAAALEAGADIVVTGRVADAALVVGPAAWRHGWGRDDWNALAGAVVAGHVIECGCQATGGNYSFFTEVPSLVHPGFPWVEVADDGTAVVGKHDGTDGEVSAGTVISQLLYEIGGPRYHTPDVTARFDTVEVAEVAPDRVRLSGAKGEPPPPDLKVAAGLAGGFRNSVRIGLTGLDIEAKADLVTRQIWESCPWDPDDYEEVHTTLVGAVEDDPPTNAAAISYLEISVRDSDEEKVGRRWSNTFVEVALGSIPGLFGTGPPGPASPYALYWPSTVPRGLVTQTVHLGSDEFEIAETETGDGQPTAIEPAEIVHPLESETTRAPLGTIVGARSGDKGGNANLGVFVRNRDAYPWLATYLTVERLRMLLPDLADLKIERFEFPRLNAINFVVHRLLDDGVSSTLRVDAQAKGLGEFLRARHADIPKSILGQAGAPAT